MPTGSREPWSNNFTLSPSPSRAAARSETPSTARDRNDLARALKERIAADMEESRPRNTSPRPHVRRPEVRPVSARVTPRRAEITHWKRPATSARRNRRDPPALPHGHAPADVHRESRHHDPSRPAGARRVQPPPLPPGHRATPLGHIFNAPFPPGAHHDTPSAARRERTEKHEEAARGSSEEGDASSLEARRELARERARVATLERALHIARRDAFDDPPACILDGFGTTPSIVSISKTPKSSRFARDESLRSAPPPPPHGATRVAAKKPPFDAIAVSAARTPLFATSGALAAYGSGVASPKAAAVAAAAAPSPFAVDRETTEAAAAAAAAAAESAVGASNLDLETTLARALHAAKRREFEAVSLARRIEGERNAAEARANVAEARLAKEVKARRAAERDSAASRARCAVFENRMETLRAGRGRLFGSGAVVLSAVPEPERHAFETRVEKGTRAAQDLWDSVPDRRRGADDGDDAPDGFFFFEIPPEFDAPPSSGDAGKENALGGAAAESPRDAGTPTKKSSVREKTPGMTPRGRTPRRWAL